MGEVLTQVWLKFIKTYRIRGNIDSDFNLAIWRIAFQSLKFAITYNLPLAT